jgi:tetratricopeptide (TPR) repeat protein
MIDDQFVAKFDALLELAFYDQAIALAEEMIERNPHSVFYREHLGIALWVAGQHNASCEILLNVRRVEKLSETADLILIHAMVALQRRKQATRLLKEFLEREDLDRDHLEQLASKFGKLREYSMALCVCQHLVAMDATNADAWYGIGFYQERIGVPPTVTVSAFRKAMLLSRSVSSRIHLAKILAQLEQWREAYLLVREVPVPALRRLCWAHTVFQVALANQDYKLAETIRRSWLTSTTYEPLNSSKDNQ